MTIQLKIEEFSEILFNGYDYKLPDYVFENLNSLVSELGINISIQTNSVSARNQEATSGTYKRQPPALFKRSKSNQAIKTTNDETWNRVKEFKTTKIDKKEGSEKIFNEIRACLNKISEKSYQTQLQNIKQFIQEESDMNVEFLGKIANFIVDVASTNKLNSVLYSNLYKELMLLFPDFQSFIDNILITYVESIKNIKYVDHNVDYDSFCDNNKANDKRKAIAGFMVNLMNIEVLSKESVKKIILTLQEQLFIFIEEPNRLNEVDEITENIFIFVNMMKREISTNDSYVNIFNNIQTVSQYKCKEHCSLSSRALFKYLDMMDLVACK